MKKILCAILAIGMLCGAAAFVGCGKKSGSNVNVNVNSQSQSNVQNGGNDNDNAENDNIQEAPGEWNDDWM